MILVILQVFLIPNLVIQSEEVTVLSQATAPIPSPEIFNQSFTMFILVQGVFAGLATGKMSEGSIVAGFKHSVILTVIGYGLFSVSVMIF